jgi:hypothetical protein
MSLGIHQAWGSFFVILVKEVNDLHAATLGNALGFKPCCCKVRKCCWPGIPKCIDCCGFWCCWVGDDSWFCCSHRLLLLLQSM